MSKQPEVNHQIQRYKVTIQTIRADLEKLNEQLKLCLTINPRDEKVHEEKMKMVLIRLESIDDTLSSLICSAGNDITSNFGCSIKLEMAQNSLNSLKEEHANLRKEWYSQCEHLRKISKKIEEKDREFEHQSVYCTYQGLVLGKILWKLTKTDRLLDEMISHETLLFEVVKVIDGCLHGLLRSCKREISKPSFAEYHLIVCLCGVFSNLATTPDGRFFLLNRSTCRGVFNKMIRIIPRVLLPDAEHLKWIMLVTLYNIVICKEGEEYIKKDGCLIPSLIECIEPSNSNRIIILALKLMSALDQINKVLPIERIEELERCKDSAVIRKEAKRILSSLIRKHNFKLESRNLAKERSDTETVELMRADSLSVKNQNCGKKQLDEKCTSTHNLGTDKEELVESDGKLKSVEIQTFDNKVSRSTSLEDNCLNDGNVTTTSEERQEIQFCAVLQSEVNNTTRSSGTQTVLGNVLLNTPSKDLTKIDCKSLYSAVTKSDNFSKYTCEVVSIANNFRETLIPEKFNKCVDKKVTKLPVYKMYAYHQLIVKN